MFTYFSKYLLLLFILTSFLSSTSQAQVAFYNKLMANALIEFLFPIIFYSKSLQLCSFLIPPPPPNYKPITFKEPSSDMVV